MRAELVRVTHKEVDIKIVDGEDMHVLQWRRRLTHDEVLLNGKPQSSSYGWFNRERVFGLVFGRDEEGRGGRKVMLMIDPRESDWDWSNQKVAGVRLEVAEGPLLAYGTLDPKTLQKPATFADWMKKTMGMEWGGQDSRPH